MSSGSSTPTPSIQPQWDSSGERLRYAFDRDDPCRTAIRDEYGQIFYSTTTQEIVGDPDTILNTFIKDGRGQTIATYFRPSNKRSKDYLINGSMPPISRASWLQLSSSSQVTFVLMIQPHEAKPSTARYVRSAKFQQNKTSYTWSWNSEVDQDQSFQELHADGNSSPLMRTLSSGHGRATTMQLEMQLLPSELTDSLMVSLFILLILRRAEKASH
ncbi:hypothetical protein SISSUDRAFT_1118245 [Sistotremastrum suecicum HHB10207 ss-3]|uniref:DUF6593 domain-containing protein n=1 Tax=Sistotremastrum suecicum HHB10207 ss-3 TaxID=1314776 RepID=A0A166FFJ9_9AGAM|nr:hypothetical protein SISSUDRAFT_1118245 [Sistotremastrum suecicum HHB10207 ss-3]